jgi:hypothetical protein
MEALRIVTAREYLQPLREGGSLPAVVDTEDGMYVTKFRGAGQGPRALIAELVVGLVACMLDLPVPDIALVDVAEGFAADQRDPEIRELVAASRGINVGLRYLDGAFNYDTRAAGELVDPALAADIVWLDAYLTNPDRTARNPNLLVWERRPWLIDHGSALYAHHDWDSVDIARTRTPFPLIREHVLLLRADAIAAADHRLASALSPERIAGIMESVPDALLGDPLALGPYASASALRDRYLRYLVARLETPRSWVAEADRARLARRSQPPLRLGTRR